MEAPSITEKMPSLREESEAKAFHASMKATLRTTPVALLFILLGAVVIGFYAGGDIRLDMAWIGGLTLLEGIWYAFYRRDMAKQGIVRLADVRRHAAMAFGVASWMSAYLYIRFPLVAEMQAVFLACYSIGIMTMGGLVFGFSIRISLSWTLPFMLTCMVATMKSEGLKGLPLSLLLMLYTVYLCYMTHVVRRHSQQRMEARLKAERQSETIGLLLRDFEDSASDWLWECDAEGRMTYVSDRVDGKIGPKLDELRREPMGQIMKRLFPEYEEEDLARLQALEQLFKKGKAFQDYSYRVFLQGGWRWWTVSAKPLYEDGVLKGWRGVGRDTTHIRQHAELIERQANFDALTGLPNRFYLRRHLDEFFAAKKKNEGMAFAMCSLCNFKTVNTIYGHITGDAVLKETAARLKAFAQREQAFVARIGGPDFALFIPQANAYVDAQLEIFLETLSLPISTANGLQELSVKAGCVLGSDSVTGADYLLQGAELALASAKEQASTVLVLFDRQMANHRLKQMSLVSELRYAVANEELFALYQPQIRVADGRVAGAEALVRWTSTRVGLVSPADFIPMAEKNGYIVEIGDWVLDRACQDALDWPKEWKVSVNASAVQLMQSGFAAKVLDCVKRHGLNPERLKIEITESAFIGDSDKVKKNLFAVRDHGITVSLDDFGTGYASLSYLSKYPVNELKIDQSFVRTLESRQDSQKIVETIVRLAHGLKLGTTAEGVETEFQARLLRELGCDYYQGYLYGKPMGSAQLMSMR